MGRLLGLLVGAGHPPRPGQATLPSRSIGGSLRPWRSPAQRPLASACPGLGPGELRPAQARGDLASRAPGGAAGVTLFSHFVPAIVKQCSVKAWISLKPTPNSAKKTGTHLATYPAPQLHGPRGPGGRAGRPTAAPSPLPCSKGTFPQARDRAGSGQAEAQEWGCRARPVASQETGWETHCVLPAGPRVAAGVRPLLAHPCTAAVGLMGG